MPSSDKISRATITIQSFFRAYRDRSKYQLQHLKTDDCEQYPIMVRGNDPEFTVPQHLKKDKVVIIATSGLRAVNIACQMGADCPKLFIVDNSAQVIAFWKKIILLSELSENSMLFFEKLQQYYRQNDDLDINLEKDFQYIKALFDKYGFEKVVGIIKHTSAIAQAWEDKSTFLKLRHIIERLNYNHVYVYPSNIVSYLHIGRKKPEAAREVAQNIVLIKPKMAFVTDCCPYRFRPRNAVVIENPSNESYGLML